MESDPSVYPSSRQSDLMVSSTAEYGGTTTAATARIPARRRKILNWLPLIGVFAVFAALASWSWRKWPDIFIDFGMQLYVPWQLASGKVLYRDLMYLTGGPLSQHLHAIVFGLFDVSLTALVIFNLFVLLLLVVLLYRLFLSVADRWTAGLVCLITLSVFSFSQFVGVGNYNYVCPYSYETFHGLVLSIAAIACLSRWILDRRRLWALAAGACAGLVFLTKPDLYLALLATLVTAAIADLVIAGRPGGRAASTGLLLAGHAVPLAVFVFYYSLVWSFRGGLRAVAAAWTPVLTTSVPKNAFYQWCLGLDRPSENLILVLEYFAGFCLILAFLAVCSRSSVRHSIVTICLFSVLLLALGYLALAHFPWIHSGRALLPLMVLGCGFSAARWWRSRSSSLAFILPLLWSVFALVLLAKMGLNTRIWHYGFYLAMPAAVFIIFCLIWLVPDELRRFGVRPAVFRLLVTAFLVIGVFQLLAFAARFYQAKNFPVGGGGDRILSYDHRLVPPVEGMQQAVTWLLENTPPDSTLAALPEAIMINYLARRVNPTPFPVLPPTEFLAHGEPRILAAYVRSSPDYIVLVHRDNSEFGVRDFGQEPGFGLDMMRWIRANYSPVWHYGPEPFETPQFGIRILARNRIKLSQF